MTALQRFNKTRRIVILLEDIKTRVREIDIDQEWYLLYCIDDIQERLRYLYGEMLNDVHREQKEKFRRQYERYKKRKMREELPDEKATTERDDTEPHRSE